MHLFVAIFVYCFFLFFLSFSFWFVLVRVVGCLCRVANAVCAAYAYVCVCVCAHLYGGAKHNLPTTPAWAAVTHQRVKERERAKHRQLISRMSGKCACTSEMALLVTTLPSGVRSNDVRAAAAAAVCLFPQSPPQLRTATNHTHTHTYTCTDKHTHTQSEKQRQKTRSMRWRLRVIIEEEQWLTQREEQHSLAEATTKQQCKIKCKVYEL